MWRVSVSANHARLVNAPHDGELRAWCPGVTPLRDGQQRTSRIPLCAWAEQRECVSAQAAASGSRASADARSRYPPPRRWRRRAVWRRRMPPKRLSPGWRSSSEAPGAAARAACAWAASRWRSGSRSDWPSGPIPKPARVQSLTARPAKSPATPAARAVQTGRATPPPGRCRSTCRCRRRCSTPNETQAQLLPVAHWATQRPVVAGCARRSAPCQAIPKKL